MTQTPGDPHGIIAILYAFFGADGRLDRGAMAAQVELCVAAGVDGIAILGLATEVNKLERDEKSALIGWTAEAIAGRVPFIVTVSGADVAEEVALLREAEAAGAAWTIPQPPAGGTRDGRELMHFFSRVADAATRPVAIQNAAAYFGGGLGIDDIEVLVARHPNVRLFKAEGAAVEVEGLIRQTGGRLPVFNGRGGLEMIDCLHAGCAGFIIAPDVADRAVALYRAFRAGRIGEAERIYAEVLPAIVFAMQSLETLVTYGKRLFAARAGMTVLHDRAPALPASVFGLMTAERHAGRLGRFGRTGAE